MWQHDTWVHDDQAIVLHVRDRGLVVLTGCGHAGVINIVRHAMRLTGANNIPAVMRGPHLRDGAVVPVMVNALAVEAPEVVVSRGQALRRGMTRALGGPGREARNHGTSRRWSMRSTVAGAMREIIRVLDEQAGRDSSRTGASARTDHDFTGDSGRVVTWRNRLPKSL